MGAGLHGSARTTPRVRAELQASQEGTRALAARYGLNPKTVAKWRSRPRPAAPPLRPGRAPNPVLTHGGGGILLELPPPPLPPPVQLPGHLRGGLPPSSPRP